MRATLWRRVTSVALGLSLLLQPLPALAAEETYGEAVPVEPGLTLSVDGAPEDPADTSESGTQVTPDDEGILELPKETSLPDLKDDEGDFTLVQEEGEAPGLSTQASVSDSEIRAAIIDAIAKRQTGKVELETGDMTVDEFLELYKELVTSTPYLDRVVMSYCRVWYWSSGEVCGFEPQYKSSTSEQRQQEAEISQAIAEVMSWVPANASDLEKAKAAHDWLALNTTYDYDGGEYRYTAYGALVQRTSVCSGYARAYKMLMDTLGIPCTIVAAHNHAWNRVEIDGSWYHVDTTWDACVNRGGPVNSLWFMKSDMGIRQVDISHSGYYKDNGEITHADYDTEGTEVPGLNTRYDSYQDRDWTSYTGPLAQNDITSFNLTRGEVRLPKLSSLELSDYFSLSPSYANPYQVVCTSSDEMIAIVADGDKLLLGCTPGSATITCTARGITRTLTVVVERDDSDGPIDLSQAQVTVSGTYKYTGSDITPVPTVVVDGITLAEGTDYTLTYESNRNAGTATVRVAGTGRYTGVAQATFTIAKATPKISCAAKTVAMGKTAQLAATATAGAGAITYASSDTSVVKVSRTTGKLTPVAAGSTTVTVTCAASDNYKRATKKVTVTVAKGTPKITASAKTVTMGTTAKLEATVTAGAGELTYKSSDTSVVKVARTTGKLTPVATGSATITIIAAANDNYKRATKQVTVTVIPDKGTPTIIASAKTVKMGSTAEVAATVTAGAGELTYKSSDTSVVKVSRTTGKLTPVAAGSATITIIAAANDDWNRATKKVTVTVESVEPDAISMLVGMNFVSISEAGGTARVCFTPARTATYTLTHTDSNDTKATLYDASGNKLAFDDDSGYSLNFSITYRLAKGKTYYWDVSFYSASQTGEIPLSLSEELSTSTQASADITGERGYYLFRFVPQTSGTYVFRSTGDQDSVAWLFNDQSTDEIAFNDDGDGSNFMISASLDAGSAYFLEVQYYGSGVTGSIPVNVYRES